jgi:glycosyltransferase involved in cell wall biosynthesis
MHHIAANPPPFGERADLLFVGSFDHAPNVDAVEYLVREIMPVVWKRAPSMNLTIAGSNPPRSVQALRCDRVNVAGYVRDLDSLLRSHRVSVAPLRFGAGLKAKITQALAYGMPVVATPVAAEGFEGVTRDAMIVADDADAFARAILTVYDDAVTWQVMANNARKAAEAYAPSTVAKTLLEAVGNCDGDA